MKWIRRAAWMVPSLWMVLGCGTEEPAPTANPAAPAVTPGLQPHQRPEMKTAPAKEPPKESETKKADEVKKEESKTEALPKVEGPKTEASKSDAAAVKLTADELAAIKELPAADQDQAIKQAVCPVSGEHLGEMGKPVKVSAEGRSFFLCCDNCEEKVKKDPKAVIAKLDKK
jgi:YHS domain-containing protein